MGGSDILSIGISGARTAQRSLSTASHNIANANTEGFSRQRVIVGTRPAQYVGNGAIGKGVDVRSVVRLHNDFVAEDMRNNATIYNGLEVFHSHTSQIDNMLADESAGLAPVIGSFFSAMNNISNDPSSQSARQVLLGEANSLSERFSYINERLEALRKSTNETMKSHITDVNNIASAIADINWKIVVSRELSNGEPNDLLDQRERLLHKLSEKVTVRTTTQDDGSLNVFVGNGQTLVLGKRSAEMGLVKNSYDPSTYDVVYKSEEATSVVTRFMKGGVIGGLLEFREKVLNGAQNELGRIAIGISKTFNDQHKKGMTLDNKLGDDFFRDVAKTAPASLHNKDNGGDYRLETTIINTDNLSVSDYKLEYYNGMYTLIREQDQTVIDKFTNLPRSFEEEGIRIDIKEGTHIENGDSFYIRPTHFSAKRFGVNITDTSQIAAASPIRIRKSVHNQGTIKPSINGVTDISAPSFSAREGTLSPSMTIRFVDESHFELLDDKGKVVQAQQLDAQGKIVPSTAGVAASNGNNGFPQTAEVPVISSSRSDEDIKDKIHRSDNKRDGFDNDYVLEKGKGNGKALALGRDKEHEGKNPDPISENLIYYDDKQGVNLFSNPNGMKTGYSVKLVGAAKAGDTFVVEYNKNAVGDNKNVLELANLQNKKTLDKGTSNYSEVYSQLVSRIGSKTNELEINLEAQNILYNQTISLQEEVSGVNLDEEGADLLRFQKAYEANAGVIGAANEMFSTLIDVMRR